MSISCTVSGIKRNIGRKSRFLYLLSTWQPHWKTVANIFVLFETDPWPIRWYKWILQKSFCHSSRALQTDRQTDRRTEKWSQERNVLHKLVQNRGDRRTAVGYSWNQAGEKTSLSLDDSGVQHFHQQTVCVAKQRHDMRTFKSVPFKQYSVHRHSDVSAHSWDRQTDGQTAERQTGCNA